MSEHTHTHTHAFTRIQTNDINKCTYMDTYIYECTHIYTRAHTHTSAQERIHCLSLWRLTTFYSVRKSEGKTTMAFDFSSKIKLV